MLLDYPTASTYLYDNLPQQKYWLPNSKVIRLNFLLVEEDVKSLEIKIETRKHKDDLKTIFLNKS